MRAGCGQGGRGRGGRTGCGGFRALFQAGMYHELTLVCMKGGDPVAPRVHGQKIGDAASLCVASKHACAIKLM